MCTAYVKLTLTKWYLGIKICDAFPYLRKQKLPKNASTKKCGKICFYRIVFDSHLLYFGMHIFGNITIDSVAFEQLKHHLYLPILESIWSQHLHIL